MADAALKTISSSLVFLSFFFSFSLPLRPRPRAEREDEGRGSVSGYLLAWTLSAAAS